MTRTNRLMLVNSAVAFATALMVMITVHEFGHAIAGTVMGLRPRVFPGQVRYDVPGTPDQQVVGLLAGPAVSLVVGVLVLLVAPVPRSFWGLLVFWFGTLSAQEFTGYLMTGPFFAAGDIGAAMHLLSAPLWAYAVVFAAGVAGTVLVGRFATRRLLAMSESAAADRPAQLRSLGLFAWLIGAGLVILAGGIAAGFSNLLTPIGFVEILATLTSGIFIVLVRFFMGREHVSGQGISLQWPVAGVGLLIVVALARVLVLGPGLQL